MTAFKKFDPHAFLERERLAPDSTVALAALATLAGQPPENEIRGIASENVSQCDTGAVAAKSIELQRDHHTFIHRLDQLSKNQNSTPTPAKAAKVAKVQDLPHNFSNFSSPPAELINTAPHKGELCTLAAGVHDNTQTEHDTGPYASALVALRTQCPAYVDAADWQRAIEDGRRFITQWGELAEALGWNPADLFGLHSPPEKPAPSYRRLSRYDQTGLIWCLRDRPVVALTSTEAAYRCPNGAILKFYRRTEPALAETADVAPAMEIGNVMQPTLQIVSDAAEIAKGGAA
jgi:hypothetical protein